MFTFIKLIPIISENILQIEMPKRHDFIPKQCQNVWISGQFVANRVWHGNCYIVYAGRRNRSGGDRKKFKLLTNKKMEVYHVTSNV